MPEPEEVPVLKSDLEAIENVLNACWQKSIAEDLVNSYRQLRNRPSPSALTNILEEMVTKVGALRKSADE